MKPAENIERLIKKLHISASPELDERVHRDISRELQESETKKPAVPGPNIWRTIIKSPITKLAAAAVIIVAIVFSIARWGPDEQIDSSLSYEVTRSPVEMMTAASLNIAYRCGGIEAVEKQCEKAYEMSKPQIEKISIQKLLAEFNGT